MSQQPDYPFRLGERYENRKGLFEVLSIDGTDMTIRWDTGEQTTSTIQQQARILRNMEKELLAGTMKKGYRAPKSYGEFFTGLRAEDFSNDVTGTHWRAREQLGGAVTKVLNIREPFDSWSIYKRSEVHWASVARYRLISAWLQAKYFVRADEQEICYGLYVERSGERSNNQDDWLRFLAWMGDSENSRWFHQTLLSTGATMTNPYQDHPDSAFYGRITAVNDGSFHHHAEKSSTFAATELSGFLSLLRDDLSLNLVIGCTIPREKAVAQGTRISSTIADLFNLLLPVYESKHPSGA